MAEGGNSNAASTPDSGDNDTSIHRQSIAKAPAVKDKECPYCHQPFTSSSLGRHLDQYLAKKKPDGIHNVEEIRRMRGGITRRQVKTHRAEGSHDDESGAFSSPAPLQQSPTTESLIAPVAGGVGTRFNSPIWQSTGVINGLPDPRLGLVNGTAHSQSSSSPTSLRKNAAHHALFNIDVNRPEQMPDKELARALELALREVLDNVKAASIRTLPIPSPFPIDLQTLTFPGLCLYFLPTPRTLFSSGPFSEPTSFPVEPPTSAHTEHVRAAALEKISQWKADQLAHLPSSTTAAEVSAIAQQHTELTSQHIEIAYHHWASAMSDMQRYEQWRLEILRAYARERSKREETEEKLARAQTEARQLQAQVDMLSRCQWPREFGLFPPERGGVGRRLGKEGVRDLQKQGRGFEDDRDEEKAADVWDYETVVGKWKKVVREETARTLGVIASQSGAGHNSQDGIDLQPQPETPIANGNGHVHEASADEHGNERIPKRSKLANGTSAESMSRPDSASGSAENPFLMRSAMPSDGGKGSAFFGKRPLREVQF